MTGKTHKIGGAAVAMIYSAYIGLGAKETAIAVGVSVAGSLIPDIDKSSSTLGRKVPLLSIPIGKIAGHRQLFHYPYFYLILGFLGLHFFNEYSLYIYPLMLGIMSHLFLDSLTPLGIPLITPRGKKFNLLSIKTGSMAENVLSYFIIIATIIVEIKIIYPVV